MSSTNPPTQDLWRLPATDILILLRTDQVNVETYAKSLLSRIQERDPNLKAWVFIDADLVLARARELDAIPTGDRGSLHGIAIGVKDSILTADMPTQYNSPLYESTTASGIDAACVRTLRAHGALIMGKTTTTEFAATVTANAHQNRTCNAHATDRTPGGSSSGSAVAVADFHVPLCLGTQTGGSIVRPASFNGIWGMKATWGAVSREGLGQYSVTCDTLGVMARNVDDLRLVWRALGVEDDDGNDDNDGVGVPPPKKDTNNPNLKIGFCKTPVWESKACPNLASIWEQAKTQLSNDGHTINEVVLPDDFANIPQWHTDILAAEGRTSFLGAYLTDKDRLDPFLRSLVENDDSDKNKKKKKVSRKALLEAYDGCARLRPVWDDIASRYDVVLTPSVPDEAPLGLGHTGDAAFNKIWTILHAPAINIPGFTGSNGMPIGLTAVGARYSDLRTLEMAEEVGRVFERNGGWKLEIQDSRGSKVNDC